MGFRRISALAAGVLLAVSAAAGTVVKLNAGSAAGWYSWPQGKLRVSTVPGEPDAVRFEQLAHAGFFAHSLKGEAGSFLREFRFRIKAMPDNKVGTLEVMLQDRDGELFFRPIKLTAEWQEFRFEAARLAPYTYGGAKIVDGRLDLAGVTALRFNGWPAGRDYLIAGLELVYDAAPADEKKPEKPVAGNFSIKKIPWGEKKEDFHSFYPGFQDVTISGNTFLRNGKPSFLLGGWQLDVDGPAWLMRMFGVDVMVYNADEIYTLYAPVRKPDGSLEISWRENPWYEAVIRRFLNAGVRVWHEQKAHPQYSQIRNLPEFEEVYKAGHFVAYDPFHPEGEAMYLEMFKSWMRYTRKYPVFCYELFNEMIYDNPHLISREAFREAMKRKFGDIAAANRAWGTAFGSFDEVNPPGYTTDDGRNKALPRETLTSRESAKYPNLMIDWEKFQEDRSYEAVRRLMPKMRALDPDPKVFSTLQSHLNSLLDYARIGIKPEMLVDFSDFYSHEAGISYPESGKYRNFNQLSSALKPFFFCDAVRGFCPAKPIFNAEAPLGVTARGADQAELEKSDLAGLHSAWKFYDATAAVPEGWNAREFSDSGWGEVRVPAMWGNEGHPRCQVGIYRKHFRLDKPASGRIYLNGMGFADKAEICLNGKKLGSVDGYNARFSFDVTDLLNGDNVIAAKIENRYFLDGTYYGGIRGFTSLNAMPLVPEREAYLEERHLRSFFWSQAVRGVSGAMLSYESNLMQPSSKYLPGVKAELENLAGIVFDPAARPAARIAVIYPLETLRGVTHKDYLETIQSPATSDLVPFYAGALFSRAGVDVLRNRDLTGGRPLDYRLILLPSDVRATPQLVDRLVKYVENGGNVMLDFGALTVDDETHMPLDSSRLTGLRQGKAQKVPAGFSLPGTGAGKTRLRFLDGAARAEVELAGAKALLRYFDGAPLLAEHSLGKGKVFFLNGSFDGDDARRLTGLVIGRTGIEPDVKLSSFREGAVPEEVESCCFTGGEGRRVLFLQNLDPDGAAVAALPGIPDGRYRVRNAATGKAIPSPAKAALWSAAELRQGLPVPLRRYDPVVLLIEPESTKPLKLNGISPLRLAMLEELWREVPAVPGQPTVAVTPITGSTASGSFGVMPTARKVLTDNGFNVRNFIRDMSLDKIDILVWQQQRFKAADPERIAAFVRNGGALVLCGNAQLNYHVTGANSKLLSLLGISEGGLHSGAVYAVPAPPPPGDCLRVECRDFTKHPLTENVGSFITSGCNYLTKLPENAEILLRAPSDSSAPGKPILATFPYGKGRVVWIGDYWFLRPLNFELGGNAQLWLNIMNYLAKKPVRTLTPAELDKSLYITAAKLEHAERDEREGNTVIAVPKQEPTYLRPFDPEELSGIGGGDPIVDLMKL